MTKKYNLHPLSIAVALSIANAPMSYAFAEETPKADEAKEIEVIEVTGFKGSLLRSLNNKRLNDAVSDSIFSEDIGKSADQDIGEALQRVTGVSIQRGGGAGEGDSTTVTVRGAGPNLNNISLNGISLTSSSENQSVDLSAYSSDILNSIEVLKTSSADQDEGSLGASVLLKTFRPLDAKKDKRVLEIQGRYDDFAEENDHKISGSFSTKLLDDTLGLYITAFSEKQASRKDMYYTKTLKILKADNAIDAQTGELTGPVAGYVNGQNGYKLFKNALERDGFTAALQWAISDETEISLDVTMTDQYLVTNENSIASIGSANANLDTDPVLDPSNPWLVYDRNKEFFTKRIDRAARGRIEQIQSGVETENRIYSAALSHFFNDSFKMDFKLGYSKTVADDDYYTFLNTNNFVHVDNFEEIPLSILEPTGYDCTSGKCRTITGSGLVDFGPDINGVPQTGAEGESSDDNIVTTGFNADDLDALHLQQAYSRDRDLSDEQKTAFLDFDWDVDLGPIHQIEFGAKYQKRNKDVFNQSYKFVNTPQPFGQDALGIAVSSIQLSQVTDGLTPHGDNFLSELGYGRDSSTDGWYTINGAKAFALLFENSDVRGKPDLGNDRQVELENKAVYLKANFALLDDRLTGNIGFRYVESAVESAGYSSIKFQNGLATSRELVKIAADSSLAACTPEQLYINGVDNKDGANPAGGFDANGNFGPIESQNCYDVNYNANAKARLRYDDGTGSREDPDQFASTGASDSSNFLPSFTLNYKINEDMVARFALSKTMARPKIDSLKPGFSFKENIWGAGDSNGRINNPNLKPLESKNFDLSYEWYFNEGGVFSAAYFHKDMSNFEETASVNGHWADLTSHTTEQLEALNIPDDVLISKNADGSDLLVEETPSCKGNTRHRFQDISPETSSICDTIIVDVLRNGKGGTNQGIELGYTQNFDFLPGIFSGLGTTMNYTYSDSKTDAEVGLLGTELTSLPMENVSKHQYNISTFWEKDGNLIRLAYNHRTDSLARRTYLSGALWNEGGGQLDFSANYKINDTFTVTFNAVNLGKRIYRQYFTNISDDSVKSQGNALEGGVDKSKTIREWATGTIYRLGVRGTF